jgi:hypothetical protein
MQYFFIIAMNKARTGLIEQILASRELNSRFFHKAILK